MHYVIALLQLPPGTNPLTFTMDVAQLITLGGLIWGLSRMKSAIEALEKSTGHLERGLESVSRITDGHDTRLTKLETREETRRNRRVDDVR